MTRKIRNIVCVSAIVASCVVPAIVYAVEPNSSNGSETFDYDQFGVEVAEHDKFTKEQLDEIFKEQYDNDAYRDIFYDTIANPKSDAISTITIPIKEPMPSATISYLESNYAFPATCLEANPFKTIQFLRTSDGKVVYNFTVGGNNLDGQDISISQDKVSEKLLAVLQNGYPSKLPAEFELLSEEDFEAGTEIAAYITYNDLDSSILDEWFAFGDEQDGNEFKSYIEFLLSSEYEEKYIDVSLSNKIDIDDGHGSSESVNMGNNIVKTNYDQVYVDLYDTKGYCDLSVYNPQVDFSDNIKNLFHDNDKFEIRLSKFDLITKPELVRNLGHYREQTYNPVKNDIQLICAGEGISDCEYTWGDDVLYISQDQTYYQLVDVDMQPETFSHLFKAYDATFSIYDKDSHEPISSVVGNIYKKTDNGYEITDALVVSDENGKNTIINWEAGDYRLIVPGTDRYFETCLDFSIGTDNSDLTVLTKYDFEIPLASIGVNVIMKDGNGDPIKNTSFLVTNTETSEAAEYKSDGDGNILLSGITVGTYSLSPTSGEYVDFNRLLFINNSAAYAEAKPFEITYSLGGDINYALDNDWSYAEQMSEYNVSSTYISTSFDEDQEEPQPYYIDDETAESSQPVNLQDDAQTVDSNSDDGNSTTVAAETNSYYNEESDTTTNDSNSYFNE